MDDVRFSIRDAELLYSIPKPGGDVLLILRCFFHLMRCAPPTFDEFLEGIQKAVKVGCVRIEGNLIRVTDEWYDRIHAADDTAPNEIESLLEFEEVLLASSWTVKCDLMPSFSRAAYERAATKANQF